MTCTTIHHSINIELLKRVDAAANDPCCAFQRRNLIINQCLLLALPEIEKAIREAKR